VEKAKPRHQAGLRLPALANQLAIGIARLLAALLLAGLRIAALLLLAGLLILTALLLPWLRVVLLLLVAVGILALWRHIDTPMDWPRYENAGERPIVPRAG
jgi:hypothetical protein